MEIYGHRPITVFVIVTTGKYVPTNVWVLFCCFIQAIK